jgi:short subunit fatty acids transporter
MKRLISFFTRPCEAYLPDAFVLSLILTLIVFPVAWGTTAHSGIELLEFWARTFGPSMLLLCR